MGSSLSSSAKQLARRVAPGAPRKLKPFSPEELEALNRMAEKDQARMRELPTIDEINAKDATLYDLLYKLGGSISGRDLAPDESPQVSSSGRTLNRMPPTRPPQAMRAAAVASWKTSVQPADDQPGRLQSYIIREILEARTAAAAEGKELDLEPYVHMYGADRTKLLTLMEFCCLPAVGKFATFGHQYAFARPPAWWLRDGVSGAQFLSEPEAFRRRLMGAPVAKRPSATSTAGKGEENGGGGGGGVPGIFGGERAVAAEAAASAASTDMEVSGRR